MEKQICSRSFVILQDLQSACPDCQGEYPDIVNDDLEVYLESRLIYDKSTNLMNPGMLFPTRRNMTRQAQIPKPMSFAILRNTHEVFRKSVVLMGEYLDKGTLGEFRQEWKDFRRFRGTHLAMEEDAVFSLLDEVGDGAITEAGLSQEHLQDFINAELVEQAATTDEVAQAFGVWKIYQLEHLAHEERVIGPLTMKTAPTPQERGRVVHERLILPAIEFGDFDWYLAFAIKRLTAYGTAQQPPNVAVRVFAWGLQYASTPGQWDSWKEIVHRNTSGDIWQEMVEQFQIDGEGKIIS